MAKVKTELSRADMEAVIADGGSVMHGGKIITKITDLPDDVELAESERDLEAAAEQLERDELELEQRRRKLEGRFRQKSEQPAQGDKQPGDADDLEKLTKAELLEKAVEVGAEATDRMNKAEIIEAINAAIAVKK